MKLIIQSNENFPVHYHFDSNRDTKCRYVSEELLAITQIPLLNLEIAQESEN